MVLDEIVQLAIEAGKHSLLFHSKNNLDISYKSDKSPCTEADIALNTMICEKLKLLTPGIPIIAEESSLTDYEERKSWDKFWLIDPIDGTKEFIKGGSDYTVNIALVKNQRPVLGVVYAPARDLLYYADKNDGKAYRKVGDKISELNVSDIEKSKISISITKSHMNERTQNYLNSLNSHFEEVELVRLGSSLKICKIAEDSIDLYPRLGRMMEWDTAAAECVLEVAGGKMINFNTGEKLIYNKENIESSWFIAGRPVLVDKLFNLKSE